MFDSMANVLDHMPDPVVVVDEDGSLRFLNARAEAFFGVTRGELMGACGDRLIPGGVANGGELEVLRSDGERVAVELHCNDLPDGAGTIVVVHDIRARKSIEDDLRLERVAANVSRLAKSEFFMRITHALKTPLHAIIGFSDILADPSRGVTDDTHRRYVQHVQDGGRRLLALIDDLLDLARAESGKVPHRVTRVDPVGLIQRLLSLAGDDINQRHINASFEHDEGLLPVVADPVRLKSAIYNVLDGAIRCAGDGGRLTVRAERLGDAAVAVAIASSTRNAASPPPAHDTLYSRPYHGTDLGLLLADRFVRLHHGTLSYETDDRGNTTVTLTLPNTEDTRGGEVPA